MSVIASLYRIRLCVFEEVDTGFELVVDFASPDMPVLHQRGVEQPAVCMVWTGIHFVLLELLHQ